MWPVESTPFVDREALALGIGFDEHGNPLPGTIRQLQGLRVGRWPLIAGGSEGPGGDGGSGGQGDADDGNISGSAGTAGAPGTGADDTDDDATADGDRWPDEAKRLIRKLRDQQAQAEREAREAKRQLDERSQAGMSEAERNANKARQLEQELNQARNQIRQQAMRDAFRAAGEAAGAAEPSAIWMLIDRDSVDFGPDGEVLNATQLVRDLKRTKAWAFKGREGSAGSADAAQSVGQRAVTGSEAGERNRQMNEWVRGATGRRG